MTKITAMTTICADIFDATGEIRPGGEALNFAAVACEYPQVQMSLISVIAEDECGREALRSIEKKRIDKSGIHMVKEGITANNRIYLTEAGDRYFKADSWNGSILEQHKLTEEDRANLAQADLVFLNYDCPNREEVLALKGSCHFKLAIDFDVMRDFTLFDQISPAVDFFFISGEEKLLPQFNQLSEKYPGIYNITLAEQGSVSYQNGIEYRVGAVPVKHVVDTTGCGDSYHAGFICSYMEKRDITAAMEEGSRIASQTLSHVGGFLYK